MFDITGQDISNLTDGDLRTLVARLAQAELATGSGQLSGVTAGGAQDAADGGIDVRVEQQDTHENADYVPRRICGFQAKKPDLAPAAIRDEMRPAGILRSSIAALADAGGAYLIASAGASLSDSMLGNRRAAMREAVADHPNGDSLLVDFYDRDRLAAWVNQYPGVAAWVRRRIGREIAGWRPVGAWRDLAVAVDAGYLVDDGLMLVDERQRALSRPIVEGIEVLRDQLRSPGQCSRLIGLSGLGKTRLVEALFEQGVGQRPLDPALSVYADFADATNPSAVEMAHRLLEDGRRAILIVDNCNPTTHKQLVDLCSRPGSTVSLLTVEYDIRDDEPEETQVFRLVAASEELIETWLERDFPVVSNVDRRHIAQFSGGNFRVARALAGTIQSGESLGRLRDEDLFERIFRQRNDADQSLLRDAETLSLFYSFDITEGDDGELARIAAFAGRTPRDLFNSLAEFEARGVLQARGRWRAVLPHAIANRLAASALKRLPPRSFDQFCAGLPDRMLRSMSRRLGMLHDVAAAKAVVGRWLEPTGPVGNLLDNDRLVLLLNIAPVAPAEVLGRIEALLDGESGADHLAASRDFRRANWVGLLKSLAYDPDLFTRAAFVLARFVAAEAPDENYDSARGTFSELFQLYLSGTQALPQQRRELIESLLASADSGLRRAGLVALKSLLEADHFSSGSNHDFGARPRDFGWQPRLRSETADWFARALTIVRERVADRGDQRRILADSMRSLWGYEQCRAIFEGAAEDFMTDGGWIEGWSALRTLNRYDAGRVPEAVQVQTRGLIERLAPIDLLGTARAYVLSNFSGAWQLEDAEDDVEDASAGWRRANDRAQETGRAMALEPNILSEFLPELLAVNDAQRAPQFGLGLAEGAHALSETWSLLREAFGAVEHNRRNATALGSFLRGAMVRDAQFVASVLDAAVVDPVLAEHFVFLQAQAGIDATGIDRLIAVLSKSSGAAALGQFGYIRSDDMAVDDLKRLLDTLVLRPGGPAVGLDLLSRRFYRGRADPLPVVDPDLLERGRELLARLDPNDLNVMREYGLRDLIAMCFAGVEGEDAAHALSTTIYNGHQARDGWRRESFGVVDALFVVQPRIALSIFIDGPQGPVRRLFRSRVGQRPSLYDLDPALVVEWANQNPSSRYPRLGEALSMFDKGQSDETRGLDPLFLALLRAAPDKAALLGTAFDRFHPGSWSGSLAAILEHRKSLLDTLPDHPEIASWLARALPEVDRWIAAEQQRENEREESFE